MKNKNNQKPFHLHLEHFFRKQYCLVAMMLLMVLAVIRSDARLSQTLRQAYVQGFGIIGQFMREETTRVPVTFDIAGRLPTVSGR